MGVDGGGGRVKKEGQNKGDRWGEKEQETMSDKVIKEKEMKQIGQEGLFCYETLTWKENPVRAKTQKAR